MSTVLDDVDLSLIKGNMPRYAKLLSSSFIFLAAFMYSPDILALIVRVNLDFARHIWKVPKNIPPSFFPCTTFPTAEYTLSCP